jgi:hypothetical protein
MLKMCFDHSTVLRHTMYFCGMILKMCPVVCFGTEFAKPSNFSVRHRTDRGQISAGPSKLLVVLYFTNISELF